MLQSYSVPRGDRGGRNGLMPGFTQARYPLLVESGALPDIPLTRLGRRYIAHDQVLRSLIDLTPSSLKSNRSPSFPVPKG